MPIKSFNSIGTQKHMIAFKINKSINCVLRLYAHQFYLDSIKITNPFCCARIIYRPSKIKKIIYHFTPRKKKPSSILSLWMNECCNFNLRYKNKLKIPFKFISKCSALISKELKYVELLNMKRL